MKAGASMTKSAGSEKLLDTVRQLLACLKLANSQTAYGREMDEAILEGIDIAKEAIERATKG